MTSKIYNELIDIAENRDWKMAKLEQINDEKIGIAVCSFKNKKTITVFSDKVGSLGIMMPLISLDGEKVAFWKNENFEKDSLFTVNSDGSNLKKLLDIHRVNSMSWSPDSKKIAFTGTFADDLDTKNCLFTVDVDTKQVETLIEGDVDYITNQAWAPDGHKIVYVTIDATKNDIVKIYNLNTKEANELTIGNSPSWSPLDNHIIYIKAKGLNMINSITAINLLLAKNVFKPSPNYIMAPIFWLPNGQFIIYGRGLSESCEIGQPFIRELSSDREEEIADDSWMLSSWAGK